MAALRGPRGPYGSRVVLNRSRLDAVTLAIADGMFAVMKEIVDQTTTPDSPRKPWPLGEGLPKQGGALVYVNGKKVAGYGLDGKQPKVPRAAHISRTVGAVAIAGWGFPARFNEMGTVRQPARPFFTPTVDRVLPRLATIMAPITSARLNRF